VLQGSPTLSTSAHLKNFCTDLAPPTIYHPELTFKRSERNLKILICKANRIYGQEKDDTDDILKNSAKNNHLLEIHVKNNACNQKADFERLVNVFQFNVSSVPVCCAYEFFKMWNYVADSDTHACLCIQAISRFSRENKKSRSNKQINFLSLRRTFLAPPGMMSSTLVGNHNTPYWEVGYLCTLSWGPSTILELMTSNEFRVKTVNSKHINQSLCSLQQFLRDMPLMSKRLVFDKHFKLGRTFEGSDKVVVIAVQPKVDLCFHPLLHLAEIPDHRVSFQKILIWKKAQKVLRRSAVNLSEVRPCYFLTKKSKNQQRKIKLASMSYPKIFL